MTTRTGSVDPIEILLIEDNPGDARLAQEALKESKINNTLNIVSDGLAALDYLYRRGNYADAARPDIIFLDLNLPGKDGREILEEIKADTDLRAIPVVILTTSAAEEDIARTYAAHANCYVTKPVDFEQFTKVVHSVGDFWFTIVKLPTENAP